MVLKHVFIFYQFFDISSIKWGRVCPLPLNLGAERLETGLENVRQLLDIHLEILPLGASEVQLS